MQLEGHERSCTVWPLETVQFLYMNRSEGYVPNTMTAAITGGHLKIVQWLHDASPEKCDVPSAMASALDRGSWEIAASLALQFAYVRVD